MRYEITKSVSNLLALRAWLLAQDVSFMTLMSDDTKVWVDVADNDPDPTSAVEAFVEPPAITATSDKVLGPFRHYQGSADGVDTQTITIQMKNSDGTDNSDWDGSVLAQPLSPIQVTPATVTITDGVGTFAVGPTSLPGEYDLYMLIQGDTVGYSWYRLHLSFF